MTDAPHPAFVPEEDLADLQTTVNGLAAPPPEEEASVPPLIVRLAGEEYDQELAALTVWVHHLLVPTYLGEVSSAAPWCSLWWQHPQAVARLHALWLAWQELTTPEVGGYTGPSVWARDHLDPTMAQLRSPVGPFAACTTNPSRPQHSLQPPPAITE